MKTTARAVVVKSLDYSHSLRISNFLVIIAILNGKILFDLTEAYCTACYFSSFNYKGEVGCKIRDFYGFSIINRHEKLSSKT